MENKVRLLIREFVDNYLNDIDFDNMSDDNINSFIQFKIDKEIESADWKNDIKKDMETPDAMPIDMTNLNND